MSEITIPTADGQSFKAYIATPEITPAPAVLVIQEIFGVNQGIREKCDWLASQGFLACAPDLFWRIEPEIELSDKVPEELERAFELFGQFDIDAGITDIKTTRHVLRGHAQGNGKVGCLGYCLGGKLAYLTACRTEIDASIGYYGVGIEELLAEANNIEKPTMLHIAEEDGFVPTEAQEKIHAGLGRNDLVTLHSYAGMDHAFTRVGGDNYDPEAAELADSRSIEFLKSNLT